MPAAEAHRVVRSPSLTRFAVNPEPWMLLAVAGWFKARLTPGGAMLSVAPTLLTLPAAFVTITEYVPALLAWTSRME